MSCAVANAPRDRPSRKSPASASRGANAIECRSPSSPPHSALSAPNSASISSSRVTSQRRIGGWANSLAILTTRSFKSSLTNVKASCAPSRAQARATPYAIDRLDRTPVIRIFLPVSRPLRYIILEHLVQQPLRRRADDAASDAVVRDARHRRERSYRTGVQDDRTAQHSVGT